MILLLGRLRVSKEIIEPHKDICESAISSLLTVYLKWFPKKEIGSLSQTPNAWSNTCTLYKVSKA